MKQEARTEEVRSRKPMGERGEERLLNHNGDGEWREVGSMKPERDFRAT
jgi:hypothetical protein